MILQKTDFYNIDSTERAIIFVANTGNEYGIDVNKFLNKYGNSNERFEYEKEIIFPFRKSSIIKEYHCSPNQFKYYMRKRERL